MQHVFVVDATRRPLMPCRPARARRLLTQHRAAVLRRFPFTIILLSARPEAVVTPLRLKIDPGSRTTGLALVREREQSGEVVWAAELSHRGEEVHNALVDRHAVRRARRQRHTRYRPARFANRTRPRGWLPPSLSSRVQNVVTWVQRLALSCHDCNQAKGNRTAQEFGHPEVQALAKVPLRDAAAVNSTRRALHQRLLAFGLPVETASGGRTKWNRVQRGLPKTHWLDALCVGASTPERIQGWRDMVPLVIRAQRWQRHQMCLMTEQGFPRTKAKAASHAFGFRTGDIVKAVVPSGTPQGTHVGKVAIKASGYFTITTRERAVPDVPYRYCRRVHQADGYTYQKGARAFLPIL